jgi:cytochrome bd-type quinol oxidase subunit 1
MRPFRPWHRLTLLLLALMVINVATGLTLTRNLEDGVYSPDANSISIPLLSSIFVSALLMGPIALVALLPSANWIRRLTAEGPRWRILFGVVVLLLYGAIIAFAVAGGAYWARPNHYVIAATYFLLLGSAGFLCAVDLRQLLSNNRLEPPNEAG